MSFRVRCCVYGKNIIHCIFVSLQFFLILRLLVWSRFIVLVYSIQYMFTA